MKKYIKNNLFLIFLPLFSFLHSIAPSSLINSNLREVKTIQNNNKRKQNPQNQNTNFNGKNFYDLYSTMFAIANMIKNNEDKDELDSKIQDFCKNLVKNTPTIPVYSQSVPLAQSNDPSLQTPRESPFQKFIRKIFLSIYTQSTGKKMALSEMLANAIDATLKLYDLEEIGQFGEGAIQALAILLNTNASIQYTTYKNLYKSVLTIRTIDKQLVYSYQTDEYDFILIKLWKRFVRKKILRIKKYLLKIQNKNNQDEDSFILIKLWKKLVRKILSFTIEKEYQGTSVTINFGEDLSSEELKDSILLLTEKYQFSPVPILINGSLIQNNDCKKISLIEDLAQKDNLPSVDIDLNKKSFTIIDRGTGMDTKTIFTQLLVVGSSTKKETTSNPTIKNNYSLYYKDIASKDDTEDTEKTQEQTSTIHIAVNGVKITTLSIPTCECFSEFTLELPQDSWLPLSRTRVKLQPKDLQYIIKLIEQSLQMDNLDLNTKIKILNTMAILIEKVAMEDLSPVEKDVQGAAILDSQIISDFLMTQINSGKTILPNIPQFKNVFFPKESFLFINEFFKPFQPLSPVFQRLSKLSSEVRQNFSVFFVKNDTLKNENTIILYKNKVFISQEMFDKEKNPCIEALNRYLSNIDIDVRNKTPQFIDFKAQLDSSKLYVQSNDDDLLPSIHDKTQSQTSINNKEKTSPPTPTQDNTENENTQTSKELPPQNIVETQQKDTPEIPETSEELEVIKTKLMRYFPDKIDEIISFIKNKEGLLMKVIAQLYLYPKMLPRIQQFKSIKNWTEFYNIANPEQEKTEDTILRHVIEIFRQYDYQNSSFQDAFNRIEKACQNSETEQFEKKTKIIIQNLYLFEQVFNSICDNGSRYETDNELDTLCTEEHGVSIVGINRSLYATNGTLIKDTAGEEKQMNMYLGQIPTDNENYLVSLAFSKDSAEGQMGRKISIHDKNSGTLIRSIDIEKLRNDLKPINSNTRAYLTPIVTGIDSNNTIRLVVCPKMDLDNYLFPAYWQHGMDPNNIYYLEYDIHNRCHTLFSIQDGLLYDSSNNPVKGMNPDETFIFPEEDHLIFSTKNSSSNNTYRKERDNIVCVTHTNEQHDYFQMDLTTNRVKQLKNVFNIMNFHAKVPYAEMGRGKLVPNRQKTQLFFTETSEGIELTTHLNSQKKYTLKHLKKGDIQNILLDAFNNQIFISYKNNETDQVETISINDKLEIDEQYKNLNLESVSFITSKFGGVYGVNITFHNSHAEVIHDDSSLQSNLYDFNNQKMLMLPSPGTLFYDAAIYKWLSPSPASIFFDKGYYCLSRKKIIPHPIWTSIYYYRKIKSLFSRRYDTLIFQRNVSIYSHNDLFFSTSTQNKNSPLLGTVRILDDGSREEKKQMQQYMITPDLLSMTDLTEKITNTTDSIRDGDILEFIFDNDQATVPITQELIPSLQKINHFIAQYKDTKIQQSLLENLRNNLLNLNRTPSEKDLFFMTLFSQQLIKTLSLKNLEILYKNIFPSKKTDINTISNQDMKKLVTLFQMISINSMPADQINGLSKILYFLSQTYDSDLKKRTNLLSNPVFLIFKQNFSIDNEVCTGTEWIVRKLQNSNLVVKYVKLQVMASMIQSFNSTHKDDIEQEKTPASIGGKITHQLTIPEGGIPLEFLVMIGEDTDKLDSIMERPEESMKKLNDELHQIHKGNHTETIASILDQNINQSSSHRINIREEIQNGIDAREAEDALLKTQNPSGQLDPQRKRIDITTHLNFNQSIYSTTIKDNIGMSLNIILEYLFVPKQSSKSLSIEKTENSSIGQFGIGFLTVFEGAEKVIIRTGRENKIYEITLVVKKENKKTRILIESFIEREQGEIPFKGTEIEKIVSFKDNWFDLFLEHLATSAAIEKYSVPFSSEQVSIHLNGDVLPLNNIYKEVTSCPLNQETSSNTPSADLSNLSFPNYLNSYEDFMKTSDTKPKVILDAEKSPPTNFVSYMKFLYKLGKEMKKETIQSDQMQSMINNFFEKYHSQISSLKTNKKIYKMLDGLKQHLSGLLFIETKNEMLSIAETVKTMFSILPEFQSLKSNEIDHWNNLIILLENFDQERWELIKQEAEKKAKDNLKKQRQFYIDRMKDIDNSAHNFAVTHQDNSNFLGNMRVLVASEDRQIYRDNILTISGTYMRKITDKDLKYLPTFLKEHIMKIGGLCFQLPPTVPVTMDRFSLMEKDEDMICMAIAMGAYQFCIESYKQEKLTFPSKIQIFTHSEDIEALSDRKKEYLFTMQNFFKNASNTQQYNNKTLKEFLTMLKDPEESFLLNIFLNFTPTGVNHSSIVDTFNTQENFLEKLLKESERQRTLNNPIQSFTMKEVFTIFKNRHSSDKPTGENINQNIRTQTTLQEST